MKEYRGEVWQDGFLVARAQGGNYTQVNAETAHYAMMYAKDGPVTVKRFEKKSGKRWILSNENTHDAGR